MNDLGRAENRYNIFGYSQQPEDIHKLDMVVLAIGNFAFAWPPRSGSLAGCARRQDFPAMLVEHPKVVLRRVGTKFYDLTGRGGAAAVREAALAYNLLFAPVDLDHGELHSGSSVDNPVLYLLCHCVA